MVYAGEFVHQQKELVYEYYKIFEDMRQKEEFCDLTIKVGDHSVHAHKVIVSASIPYFRSSFGQNSAESCQNGISLTGVHPVALEALIDFAYRCEVKITSENAQMLLSAACFLQVYHVTKACVEFLIRTIEAKNALNLRNFGDRLGCLDLVNKIDDYVNENFDEVSQCEGFLNQPYSYVKELISSDDLHVSCEEKVFEAVMRWVKVLPNQRCSELPELLSCVRMPYVKLPYLRDYVATETLVKESLQCRDILDDATDYHLFPEKRHVANTWKFLLAPRWYTHKQTDVDETICFAFTTDQSKPPNNFSIFQPVGEKKWPSGTAMFQYNKTQPKVSGITCKDTFSDVENTATKFKTEQTNLSCNYPRENWIGANLAILNFQPIEEQPKCATVMDQYVKPRRNLAGKTGESKMPVNFLTEAPTKESAVAVSNRTTSNFQLCREQQKPPDKTFLCSNTVKTAAVQFLDETDTSQPDDEMGPVCFLGNSAAKNAENDADVHKLSQMFGSVRKTDLSDSTLHVPLKKPDPPIPIKYRQGFFAPPLCLFKPKVQKHTTAPRVYNNIPLQYVRYHPSIDSSTNEKLIKKCVPMAVLKASDFFQSSNKPTW